MLRIYTDGSNTSNGAKTASAWMIYDGDILLEARVSEGPSGWSDVAEYRAVVLALERVIDLGLNRRNDIVLHNDSQFVMNQMSGKWKAKKHKAYYPYYVKTQELLQRFTKCPEFKWIPREENTEADMMSKSLSLI